MIKISGNDQIYLNTINRIREEHQGKDLQFHIYSQGELCMFDCYKSNDTVLHIDEEIVETFVDLVAADILVTSPSAFSFSAALLNEGIVYYMKQFHTPRKGWIDI